MGVITKASFYRFLAVMLHCHNTCLSLTTVIATLKRHSRITPTLQLSRFITKNLVSFAPTVRRDHVADGATWNAQSDSTPLLDEFERLALNLVSRVFFVPLNQFITLDDDFVRTCCRDSQVKILSARDSVKERHLADVVAGAIFNAVISVRFRRRGVGQEQSSIAAMERLLCSNSRCPFRN